MTQGKEGVPILFNTNIERSFNIVLLKALKFPVLLTDLMIPDERTQSILMLESEFL